MTTPELAPCPFCGKEARRIEIDPLAERHGCKDLDCPGYSIVSTAAAWNTRAPRVPDEFWEWLDGVQLLGSFPAPSYAIKEEWLAHLRAKEAE